LHVMFYGAKPRDLQFSQPVPNPDGSIALPSVIPIDT
jgi:hypothetical protein